MKPDDLRLDVHLIREEAAENGRLFAAEVGCHDLGSAWDGGRVESCLREKSERELYQAHVSGTDSLRSLLTLVVRNIQLQTKPGPLLPRPQPPTRRPRGSPHGRELQPSARPDRVQQRRGNTQCWGLHTEAGVARGGVQ